MVNHTEAEKQENRIKIVSQVKWDSIPQYETLHNHFVTCDRIWGDCESCNQIDKLLKLMGEIYNFHTLGQN